MDLKKFSVLSLLVVTCFMKANASSDVIQIDEKNWHQILKGEWMLQFYAPWCPACKGLTPTWELLASTVRPDVKVGIIDVTSVPYLSGRFLISSVPTIYHVIDGKFRQYHGTRYYNDIISYIKLKTWKHMEPLKGWAKPDSPSMTFLAHLCKLSQVAKDTYCFMQERLGFAPWGAFICFVLSTAAFGVALSFFLITLSELAAFHILEQRKLRAIKEQMSRKQKLKRETADLEEDDSDSEESGVCDDEDSDIFENQDPE